MADIAPRARGPLTRIFTRQYIERAATRSRKNWRKREPAQHPFESILPQCRRQSQDGVRHEAVSLIEGRQAALRPEILRIVGLKVYVCGVISGFAECIAR